MYVEQLFISKIPFWKKIIFEYVKTFFIFLRKNWSLRKTIWKFQHLWNNIICAKTIKVLWFYFIFPNQMIIGDESGRVKQQTTMKMTYNGKQQWAREIRFGELTKSFLWFVRSWCQLVLLAKIANSSQKWSNNEKRRKRWWKERGCIGGK
jgi:hypothetical protein